LYHAFRKKVRPPFIPPLKGWAFPADDRKQIPAKAGKGMGDKRRKEGGGVLGVDMPLFW